MTFDQGSFISCLWPSETRSVAGSYFRTMTSISSLTLKSSEGCDDAPPRHVGDMEQAVDAAEIDERAVVGDVLDHAAQDLALRQRVQRVLLLLGVLFFEEDLAGEHDVAALLVDLDDPHAQLLAAQRVEVAHGTHVDLRAGEERADADVHRQAALDPLDHPADDHLLLGVRLFHVVPDLHLLGFFAREDDVAFTVFGALEEDVDDVAGLDGNLPGFVDELVDRDDPFGLVPDVDDDFRGRHFEDGSLDDLTFRDVAEAGIVKVQKAGILLRIDLIVLRETRRLFSGPSDATSLWVGASRLLSGHA